MNLSPETISKAIGLSEELSKALSDLRYRLNAVQCNPTPETSDQVFNAGGIVGQVAEELQETCEFFGSVSIGTMTPEEYMEGVSSKTLGGVERGCLW